MQSSREWAEESEWSTKAFSTVFFRAVTLGFMCLKRYILRPSKEFPYCKTGTSRYYRMEIIHAKQVHGPSVGSSIRETP